MSLERHDDNCPGCRPAMLDINTGQVLPEDSPIMVAVLEVWGRTTLIEREAWHRFTCQNSRLPSDLRIAQNIAGKIQEAIEGIQEEKSDNPLADHQPEA